MHLLTELLQANLNFPHYHSQTQITQNQMTGCLYRRKDFLFY